MHGNQEQSLPDNISVVHCAITVFAPLADYAALDIQHAAIISQSQASLAQFCYRSSRENIRGLSSSFSALCHSLKMLNSQIKVNYCVFALLKTLQTFIVWEIIKIPYSMFLLH